MKITTIIGKKELHPSVIFANQYWEIHSKKDERGNLILSISELEYWDFLEKFVDKYLKS